MTRTASADPRNVRRAAPSGSRILQRHCGRDHCATPVHFCIGPPRICQMAYAVFAWEAGFGLVEQLTLVGAAIEAEAGLTAVEAPHRSCGTPARSQSQLGERLTASQRDQSMIDR